jgi:hypothetical protein
MKKLLLIAVISITAIITKAQVKGVVIDSTTNTGIERAVIAIVEKSKPTDTAYYFADEKGAFSITPMPKSNFSLYVMHLSYARVGKFVPVPAEMKTIDLGAIKTAPQGKLLDEVIITGPPIVIKEDTIEYRADAFKVKEGAVVEDLLKKLPGMEVDKDGNVKAQGKNVTRVKVNGKDFFGGDVKTATKELPSNIVDKIQIIDDYGDQANVSGIKDGDAEKVMNIVLKKDKNRGFFGRAAIGAGTQDRYQGTFNGNVFNNNTQISFFANGNNTNTSLFNLGGGAGGNNRGMSSMMRQGMSAMSDMGGMGGMQGMMGGAGGNFINTGGNNGITASNAYGLNYRDQWGKRVTVYGNYSFSNRNNDVLSNTSQQNIFTDTSFINNQNNTNNTITKSHRFNFNVEYQIDSFNYVKINPNITFSKTETDNFSNFDFFQKLPTATNQTSNGNNVNQTGTEVPNYSASILYNKKFRKRGRNFSANVNIGNSTNQSEQDSRNQTNSLINPVGSFNQFQFIDQDNTNRNYGARFTYSEPLSKTRALDVTYSHAFNYARNNKQTFNVNPSTLVKTFIVPLSNDFENEFYNNRVGVSVRTTLKKYNYTLGLSTQPVTLRGYSLTKDSAYKTQNRVNVFPIARFAYNFSRTKTLNVNYSGNATQPSFSQMQDVLDISNRQYQSIGNPNLKPAINHTVNASFNNFNLISGRIVFTNLNFSTIRNQIINGVTRVGNSGTQLSKPENVNGYYNANFLSSYSRPYKNRKYVVTFNGNINYNHNINLIDNNKIIGSNWVLTQGAVLEYNIKDWFTLGSGVSYSLNDVKYKGNTASNSLINTNSNAWIFSSNLTVDFLKSWNFKYDFDYTLNNGLAAGVTQNLALMNASIEKKLFKKQNGLLRFSVFDLLNQNTSVNRSINANSIVDTRTNLLTRYFMFTFQYRLQKFVGQQPSGGFRGGIGGNRSEIRIGQ